ncbi:SPOR domain-containing protein [Bacillaceae bacterium C204]|uniref:SPOR domain-containing protein n=1 Tax=Neobacillus sp. 204 TaxID=3383351 RepID=UPI00397A3763
MTHRKREEYGLVDKPNKGNTIKIKLNGETPPHQEIPLKKEDEANNDVIPKVIKINRENTESESDVFSETAAAQESVDESFDWIIPESSDHDIEEFKIVPSQTSKKTVLPKITTFSTNTKKKNGRPFGTILISAAFAILIGTTIGVVMLKLVITPPSNKAVTTEPIEVTEKPVSTETKTSEGKNTSSAAISQLTTYVIQGGVFSSEAGAKEISSNLSKSVPSRAVEMDGKYYLFLGVADSIEEAKALGAQYKENGVKDVFAKPLLLEEKKFSNLTDKEKTFLKTVPTIYQTLSLTTSNALVTKDLSEDESNVLSDIDATLKGSVKNEKIKDLKAELVSANEKVKSYQESKEEKNLTEAQQHLLNFLSIYFSN